jgi:16S rRNA (guanine(966)-N(2))-methyltransferase RsmD
MRVTGGAMKGKKVYPRGLGKTTKHGTLRATSSKVREALFNILAGHIEGALFVDLYAGTGAVGMEAMSRGAEKVYFVEADRKRVSVLEKTLDGCGCRSRAVSGQARASDVIDSHGGAPWDIAFLDPPYQSDELERVLPLLGEGEKLGKGALVVVEHMKKQELPEEVGVLERVRSYKYGDTVLSLYRKTS